MAVAKSILLFPQPSIDIITPLALIDSTPHCPAMTFRFLVGERRTYRLHGLCHTRSTSLGGRIPVQTCMDPPLPILGAPLDLVGRDGGQVTGDFGWTLTVTNCTWHCTSW